MKVLIKYFSALRDITGKIEEPLLLRDGATLGELMSWFFKTYPKAEAFKEEIIILVNGRSVDLDYALKDGDEIAIMPPVSGGGGIVQGTIDLNKEVADIIRKTAPLGGGGVVIFVGYVKGKVGNAEVEQLDYEAYQPYASEKIKTIEEWAKNQDGVLDARIYHNIGSLKPGDTTIYVFVSTINRDVAFRVAREALERVKHEVPIFKLERRSDGDYWVLGDGKRVPRGK